MLSPIDIKRKLTSPANINFFSLIFLCGDVELNPGPSTLQFAHLNICSASSITPSLNKPALLQDFMLTDNIDIFALSETWLPSDPLPSMLNSLTPSNFSIISSPRLTGKGGGTAFIFRSYLKFTKIDIPTYPSFESLCLKLTIASKSFIFLTIYRPPSLSLSDFFSDFSALIDFLNTFPSELIISGDFNIHVDQPYSIHSCNFQSLLDSSDLKQHVSFPTHKHGHTLDLLLSRNTSNIISSVEWSIPFISDHYTVHASIDIPTKARPSLIKKLVRSFRKIDINEFSKDVLNSVLHSSSPSSLDSYFELFTSTLSSILDKHAPQKLVSSYPREPKPYITPEILSAKSLRSKLETIYRRTRLESDKTKFKTQAHHVAKLITSSRRTFFRSLINKHKNQPRHLWSTLNTLLNRKSPPSLPTTESYPVLAMSFLTFFNDKISKLCSAFPLSNVTNSFTNIFPPSPPPIFDHFSPATPDEISSAILASSDATCSLDTIPTFLLKACLPSLLIPITNLVNLSLAENKFPLPFKHAIVTPLLKKFNLQSEELCNYRPISNLNFISKIIERIIQKRLCIHLNSFNSITPFQSAYRRFHSTETALLKIQNDLLLSANEQKTSALILLDLSAAFDTIDHSILLSRLTSFYGISGSALDLIRSYLTDRTQSVLVNNCFSPPAPILTGVPQGSVLGPLLFSLYTSPISQIFSSSSISFHLFADDTQIYVSFPPSDSSSYFTDLSDILNSVHNFLTSNRLTVNPTKTEFLLIGTPQQRSKVTAPSISFQGSTIIPSKSARNLGFVFDSHLSHHSQISSVSRSSFLQIRQIRQIRSSLDTDTSITLANSLVSSKLDYCNSLYYNLPNTSLKRLQSIQNSLARVVLNVKRHEHITPSLRKLHWLPIHQRIIFKIACITFKTIHNQSPTYLHQLLTRHNPSRSLRTRHQNTLVCPRIHSNLGRRSFSYASPTIWNSLPTNIRALDSLALFRSSLKTFLFPPPDPPSK
jgi:hypothetical protein